MNSEPKAWIFLNHVRDLGPMRFHELLAKVGSVAPMLRMSAKDFCALDMPRTLADFWIRQFQDPELEETVNQEIARIEAGEFRAVCELDSEYPASLKELADRPPVLYIKGVWPMPPGLALGIVGTRQASPYGVCVAERFTIDFVQKGIVTVSGLAAGIDTCVHRTTLQEKGHTVAVLGHGFNYQFPRENKKLFEEIAEKGTLVTEFPFEARPDSRHFPRRNRIISGLSRGVLVVEAGDHSGALITARYAAEQGRDVFVVPGSVYSPQSRGCHRLIKEGAKLVETAEDLLEDYGFCVRHETAPDESQRDNREPLTPMEAKLLERVSCIPVSVDELAETSGTPVDRLAELLLSLELKGRIQALPGQQYVTYN